MSHCDNFELPYTCITADVLLKCHQCRERLAGMQTRAGQFVTYDSGERAEYASGMVRDTTKGKPRYDLIPLPMLKRVAELYARGAEKYGDRNWELADSEEEMRRFEGSAFRHFVQMLMGERDEDHMAAVVFNLFARETVWDKLNASSATE